MVHTSNIVKYLNNIKDQFEREFSDVCNNENKKINSVLLAIEDLVIKTTKAIEKKFFDAKELYSCYEIMGKKNGSKISSSDKKKVRANILDEAKSLLFIKSQMESF